MIALLVLLLLVVLLFSGLGLFVAKVFLWGLLIALVIGVVSVLVGRNRGSRSV